MENVYSRVYRARISPLCPNAISRMGPSIQPRVRPKVILNKEGAAALPHFHTQFSPSLKYHRSFHIGSGDRVRPDL